MRTRVLERAITRGGVVLFGLTSMTVGLPAHSGYDFQCHDNESPAYCHWGDGGDCSSRLSIGADFCDMHGGIMSENCDEIGGMVACLS
ncbi:MAG: hypothetical protein ACRD3G_06775 [Vicinamibacterales bacterium]